jgi:hypothetical protein
MNKYARLYLEKIAYEIDLSFMGDIKKSVKDVGQYNPAIKLPSVKNVAPNIATNARQHQSLAKGLSSRGNNVSATQTPAVTNNIQHSAMTRGYSAAPLGVKQIPNGQMIMPSQKQMKLDSDASMINYEKGNVLDTPSINPNAPAPSKAVPPINKQVLEKGLRDGKYKLLDDKGNPVEIPPLY